MLIVTVCCAVPPFVSMATAVIVTSFSAMFWYNSLVTPLAFMVLAFALLWRNADETRTDPLGDIS